MKNILVLTDFSNNAYNALYYASRIFKSRACNFFLLNAYSDSTTLRTASTVHGNGNLKMMLQRLGEESQEELNHTWHRINLDHKCPSHKYELISKKMGLVQAISQIVENKDIDLVVMGNRGEGSGIGVFWGSTTTKVLASIKNCPVLTVPITAEFEVPYEIAFATNYKRIYHAKMLDPLREMATLCGSAIRIVHINEEDALSKAQSSNLDTLRAYLGAIDNSIHWMPNFTTKTKAIQVFLDELGIGMLAMVNQRHGFLENLLLEPVIKKLAFNLDIPFLVIPGTE